MVIRGPFEHPGANAVEDENGRLVNLTQMPLQVRDPFVPKRIIYLSWNHHCQEARNTM